MQVRSSDVYWPIHDPHHFAGTEALTHDLDCDVAIVGGGVTGALVASLLAKRGVDVAVFDRAQPGAGSTSACTALVQYELDQPLTSIAKMHDLDTAIRAYQTCVQSLDWLEEHIRSLDDDCQLVDRPTLLLAKKRRDLTAMKDEAAARQAAGIHVSIVEEAELKEQYGVDRPGAIRSPRSFELDPYRLTTATLDQARENGAKVYSPVDVYLCKYNDGSVTLTASHGPAIRAKHVIVATGYKTKQFLHEEYGQLLSTWAAVSEPIDVEKYWKHRQLMWEWGQGYIYARLTADDRVIFGGGDRNFTNPLKRDAMIESKTNTLKKQIEALMPGLTLDLAHRWAGEFAQTPDGMPYIGPHEKCPHTYLALGYGGNGVTFSMIAARILTGIICDDAELRAPADLFRFDR